MKNDKDIKGAVRATVLGISKQAADERTRQLGASKDRAPDLFDSLLVNGKIIEPPFDMTNLSYLCEESSALGPLVEVMEVNIEGFGHQIRVKDSLTTEQREKFKVEIEKEKKRLRRLFNHPHPTDSLTMLRRKKRHDQEFMGNAYWEMIENQAGAVAGFNFIPGQTIRMAPLEREQQDFEFRQVIEEDDFKIESIQTKKRFRKFVQVRQTSRGTVDSGVGQSTHEVWFKEFGDERTMDCRSGEYVPEGKIHIKYEATALMHFRVYSPRSSYGVPRWIGNAFNVFGLRATQEINMLTFRSNNIPSMIITVDNGMLTTETVERIQMFAESQIQGDPNYSRFLLLEGQTTMEGVHSPGTMKIDVKELTDSQHTDMLFQNYIDSTTNEIREAFRIPNFFLGDSQELNRATAEALRKLTDEQVFDPERQDFDHCMNNQILPSMGIRFCEFKTNTPNVTDNKELVQMLAMAEKTGGMNPRIARVILGDVLGMDLSEIDDTLNPDLPFTWTLAQAVKNLGPLNQGTVVQNPDSKKMVDDPHAFIKGLIGLREELYKYDFEDKDELVEAEPDK